MGCYHTTSSIAADLRPAYLELGHKLYEDKETCKRSFFTTSWSWNFYVYRKLEMKYLIPSLRLWQLRDRVTHAYTGALFHLFDEATQPYALAIRVVTLLKRTKGTVAFGRHQAVPEEGLVVHQYGHAPASSLESDLEGEEFAQKLRLT